MRSPQKHEKLKTLLQDNQYLEALQKRVYPKLKKLVLSNSGSSSDAKDLFQDCMVVLFRKAHEKNFVLTSSVDTFIYAIAKRMWLHKLRKRKPSESLEVLMIGDEGNKVDELVINEERNKLYLRHFNQLSAGCKDLLQLFFKGLNMKEITKILELSSVGYARKKKHGCQEKLLTAIKADPIYKELLF